MDPLIRDLKTTTFFGERLTRRRIADIQETVGCFPKLSFTELGHTLCVHFGWQTPKGSNRLQFALRLLEELERLSILTLPPRQSPGRGPQKPVELTSRTAPQPALEVPLAALRPLRLRLASGPGEVAEWNEWVERYHPLGYRQPVGAHLRYFVLGPGRAQVGLPAVRLRVPAAGLPRRVDRLAGPGAPQAAQAGGAERKVFAVSLGCGKALGLARAGPGGAAVAGGLAGAARLSAGSGRHFGIRLLLHIAGW